MLWLDLQTCHNKQMFPVTSQELKMCFKVSFQVAIILLVILPWIMANTCRPGSYTVAEQNGSFIACRDCATCPPMYGVTVPCNTMVYRGANIACILCDLGKTFSSEYNEQQCQPCNSKTCHRNEEVVGVCTRTVDNSYCNGTCVKGYYWHKNHTDQPCKPLTFSTSLGHLFTNLYMVTTTILPRANITDRQSQNDHSYLVIKIAIPVAFVCFFVIAVVLCWCKYTKKRQRSKYAHYQRTNNDIELSTSGVTVASPDVDSTNAEDSQVQQNNTAVNNNGKHESKLASKLSDLSSEDVRVDVPPSLETVGLDPRDGASGSLSTPCGTPTPEHKGSLSREPQDLRKMAMSRKRSVQTDCKVVTHKIDDMDPIIYVNLCNLLNLELPFGDDYKILGSHLGYVKNDMDIAGNQKKPTASEVILDDWGKKSSGNTVLALAKIVHEKMKRSDVLKKLEEELNVQREKCKCGSCPPNPSSAEEQDAL